MRGLSVKRGNIVYIGNKKYEVLNAVNLKEALLRDAETGETGLHPIQQLRSEPERESVKDNKTPYEHIKEEHMEIAKRRLNIIKPLLRYDRTRKDVEDRARKFGISAETLYNWINKYEAEGTLSSLAPEFDKRGGKGKHRVSEEVAEIITKVIEDYLEAGKRLLIKEIYKEVKIKCMNIKIKPPHENTVRNRINEISKRRITERTEGSAKAQALYDPIKGSFNVRHPLEVIQIDETPLDIIVVDEVYRQSIGRPYITVAEDIYSRVVYGFYISVEHPSFFTAGQCIYIGALPKQGFLKKTGIEGEWDVWGLPKSLIFHTDNAKWFRGKDLRRFCDEYGLSVTFRPKKMPKYGGHIERFIGTINQEMHKLPGTTYSNPKDRGEYDSEGKAVLTINELEAWITNFIVKEYHKRPHEGLGKMMPMAKYEQGIFGDETTPGTGLPDIISGEDAIRLQRSLLPSIERTIQRSGVIIDGIPYYSDVLRQYAEREELGKKKRRKYFFKRNPGDISIIYFYAPDKKDYFPIPYKNVGWPPISVPELRKVQKYLKDKNIKGYNEYDIFKAHAERKRIEEEAAKKTKAVRREHERSRRHMENTGKNKEASSKHLYKAAKDAPDGIKKAVEARLDDIFAQSRPLGEIEVIHRGEDEEGK
jgi:putative transposase